MTREEVEELVKGEEAAKQADGGESNEEVNEDEVRSGLDALPRLPICRQANI